MRELLDSIARIGRLVRKELFEILRDRRMILTLVFMPMLLYPLLSVAFKQFFLAKVMERLDQQKIPERILGFETDVEGMLFLQLYLDGKDPPGVKRLQVEKDKYPDLDSALQDGAIHLGIRLHRPEAYASWLGYSAASPGWGPVLASWHHLAGSLIRRTKDEFLICELVYLQNAPNHLAALDYVERLIAAHHARQLQQQLGARYKHPRVILTKVQRTPLEISGRESMISLAALVPLILILMTITGAVYPAIDLTAGERERGTLEILVAAPVPRLGLLFAKYVTVVVVAVLTGLVNMAMMMATLVYSQLGPYLFGDAGVSFDLIVQLIGLLLLFALFFSALLLSLTCFARSFKEAQAYLIPLMLVSLAPGLAGMIPGLKLEGTLMAAPLLNIVLLARDLFEGRANPTAAGVVIVTTGLYALAALAAAARIFGAESVLYNEQSSWSDLFRRPAQSQGVPTLGAAFFCLALMFPAWFFAQSLDTPAILERPVASQTKGPEKTLQAISLEKIQARLRWATFLSVVLFAGFPLFSAYWGRVRLRSGFLLTKAPALAWPGAVFLGVFLWPLVVEFLVLAAPADLSRFDPTMFSSMKKVRELTLPWFLVSVIAAALVEEFFFRGFLFSALRTRAGAWTTIFTSALTFGFFHLVTSEIFGMQRFLASTLLGLILSWVCWQSRSVLPGMLLHVIHNAMLVLVGPGEIAFKEHVPWEWLTCGAGGTLAGAGLIFWVGTVTRHEMRNLTA